MPTPALVARDLTKDFGALRAVDGLSLDVAEGEVLGFLGPNGAGKTTSIRMMTGLLPPTSGTIEILGERVEPGGGRAKSLTGVCPQEIVVWDLLTAMENLVYVGAIYGIPAKVARERGLELLRLLGLEEKRDARAQKLSGGMKRRLNVAMALVHDPKLVVLDEPEAGLDPQARVVLREFLQGLRREGRTLIFTTHNMDEAERLVDRVAVIDHGKLIALDTPAALKRRIGAGDVLEVKLKAGAEGFATRLQATQPAVEVAVLDATVVVRGLDLASRFAAIMGQTEGLAVEDVRYRGNSLEDVFISLTGRGLRE